MWVECVVLEDHRDVAVAGRDVVHEPIANVDFAPGNFLEAGDHPKRRRFAAARGSDQHHELAGGDLQRDVPHGVEAAGVFLVEMFQNDVGHEAISIP